MSRGFALLVGSAVADGGLTDDQSGTSVALLSFSQSGVALGGVIGVGNAEHTPVVGFETGFHIFGESKIGGTFDGDGVVIVEDDQIIQFQVSCQRSGLTGATFHHAAVTGNDVDLLVSETGFIKTGVSTKVFESHSHTHCRGKSAAQGTGGHVDTGGVTEFRMTGSQAAPLTELLDLFHGHAFVVEKVEQTVDQHGAVSGREDETVTSDPFGIGRIVAQILIPEGEGVVGAAEGHTGVTGLCFLDRFGSQHTDRVGTFFCQIRIVHCVSSLFFVFLLENSEIVCYLYKVTLFLIKNKFFS